QKIGLLKMDFLGLRNLSIIEDTLKNLEQTRGLRLDLGQIRWDDAATFALLQAADTNGVFQLESPGLRRLLQDMRPTSFEDITAAIALFRPGPLEGGLVDQYMKCKHGEQEIVYPLPQLEPILKETYGVIVYQEQVMQIASQLAGFSLGEADVLRAAMGKKKKDEMAKMRAKFIAGAVRLGVIKNVGAHAIELLLTERRAKGPFKSLLDLTVRVDPRELNKRVLESLIRSGATDSLGERGRLLASIDRVTDRAGQIINERESGQTSLFGMLPDADEMDDPGAGLISAMPPMPDDERLKGEKELLGLYLSDHPLRRIEQELHLKVDTYANQVTPEMENYEVRIG